MTELARVVTYAAPTVEPVDLAAAKDHLRVSHSSDDAMIERLIQVARENVENLTGVSLVTRTVDIYFDEATTSPVELPVTPVQSITSVTTYDAAGNGSVMNSSLYRLDSISVPPRLFVDSWPAVRDYNAVAVRAVVGYAAVADIPASFKQAILLIVGELYERREESIVGTSTSPVQLTSKRLLALMRRYAGVA